MQLVCYQFKIYLEIVRFWHRLLGLQPHVSVTVERVVSRWEESTISCSNKYKILDQFWMKSGLWTV